MFSNLRKKIFYRISIKINIIFSMALVLSFGVLLLGLTARIQSAYERDYELFLRHSLKEAISRIISFGVEPVANYYHHINDEDNLDQFSIYYKEPGKEGYFLTVPDFVEDLKLTEAIVERLFAENTSSDFYTKFIVNNTKLYINGQVNVDGAKYAVITKGIFISHRLAELKMDYLVVFLPTVIVFLLIGNFLASILTRPLRDIMSSIHSLEKGNLSTRIPVTNTQDEIEEIQKHFNSLLDKVEKLVNGLREAFDNLAHDIRTPVTRLRGKAELVLNNDHSGIDDYRDALQSCFENSDKILSFLQTLTDITEAENRSRDLKKKKHNISELAAEMVDLYEMAFEDSGITLKKNLDEKAWALVDGKLISRVIANLLDNAHKFSPPGTTVTLETRNLIDQVIITVTDQGVGIAPEEQKLVFDKLYRSDKSRSAHGMGLGLAFVKAVVDSHDGKIKLISPVKDGRGTQFEIILEKMP